MLAHGGAPNLFDFREAAVHIASSAAEAELIGYAEAQKQAESLNQLLQVFGCDTGCNIYGDCVSAR